MVGVRLKNSPTANVEMFYSFDEAWEWLVWFCDRFETSTDSYDIFTV